MPGRNRHPHPVRPPQLLFNLKKYFCVNNEYNASLLILIRNINSTVRYCTGQSLVCECERHRFVDDECVPLGCEDVSWFKKKLTFFKHTQSGKKKVWQTQKTKLEND